MPTDNNTRRLYNALKTFGYKDIPEYANFEGKLKDSAVRESLYSKLKSDGVRNLPNFTVFEEWLGYPMPEDLKQQQSTNQEDKSKDSFFDDLGDRFMSGTNRTLGSVANLLDKGTKVLENTFGIERSGTFGEAAESFNRRADEYRKESNRYNGKDFVQLAKEGDWGGALGEIFLSATESAPQSLGIIASGGTGLTAAGLMAANDKYDQLIKDNPDMNRGAALVNSAVIGLSEYLTECLGAGAIGKLVRRSFALGGKEAAGKAISDYLTSRSADFMAKHGIIGPVATEAMEEMINAATEYGTDLITGVQRDDSFGEAVAKAGVYGAAGGAQFTPMTVAANYVARRRLQNASAEETPSQSATQNQEQMREDAIQRGKEMPETDYHSAYQSSEQSRQSLSDIDPNLTATIDRYVNDESSPGEVQSLFDGLDETVRPLAEAYYQSQLVMRGITERNLDDAESEVQAFADRIAPFAVPQDDGRRLITTAHFSKGLTERDVYVTAIEGDKAVIFYDDGSKDMVPVERLQNIREWDADDLIARYRENALDGKNTQMEFRLHHHPKTQPAQPGLVIFNGDKAYILQQQDEKGDWVAYPAALDKETGTATEKQGSEPIILTENEVLELQDAKYASQTSDVSAETPSEILETRDENQAGTVSPEARLKSLVETLPKRKDGSIDYSKLTPEQQFQYTSLTASPEEALSDLRKNRDALDKELENLNKQLGSATGGKQAELRDKIADKREEIRMLDEFYQSVVPSQTEEETENNVGDNVIESESQSEVTNPLQALVETLPKKKDGSIDYVKLTPEQQYQYTSLSESPEIALQDLQRNIEAGNAEIEDLNKQLENAAGWKRTELRDKIQAKREESNALKEFYQSVAPQQPQVGKEEAQTAQEEVQSEKEEKIPNEVIDTIAGKLLLGRSLTPEEEILSTRARKEIDAKIMEAKFGEGVQNLSEDEATAMVEQKVKDAPVMPVIEISPQNWNEEFGENGEVDTPIGKVKIGENQYLKLLNKGRGSQMGMIKPTLSQPDWIIEQYDPKEGVERNSKYLFVKTFKDGSKGTARRFESVTVSKDGKEVVVSNHLLRKPQLIKKLQEGRLLYNATSLDTSGQASPEQSPQTDTGVSSKDKGTELSERQQANKQKKLPDINETMDTLLDGSLSIEEVDGIVAANISAVQERLEKIEKDKPVPGVSISKYKAKRGEWAAKKDAAQKELDYWKEINNQLKESRQQPGKDTGGTGDVEGIRQAGSDVDSADGVAQAEGRKIEPVGTGPFGPIYDQFRGDAQGAIRFLSEQQDGEAIAALNHPDVGDIDLVWGKPGTAKSNGYGLSKLVKFHPEVLDNLQDILNDMQVATRSDNRINLESPTHKAAVRLEWDGERKNWLLTAFEKETPTSIDRTTDIGENPTDLQNDTAPLQNVGVSSEGKGSNTSSENQTSAPEFIPGESEFDYAQRVVEANKRKAEERKVDTNPTQPQKEAGNYKKGHIKLDGFDITIENPKGSTRSGVDANGNPWSVTMNNTYGYIRGTEGVDGDHIDVFLSDDPTQGDVFVIDQVKADGTFDEHKVMYGFPSEKVAREAYLANYSPGWQGLGNITQVSKEEFKKWVDSSKRKTKPFAKYKNIRFRFIGERGAANLDRAEEATTRMDNLSVARDMENAFNEKQARIEKLRESKPVEITGEEYKGKYELKRDSAKAWIKDNLRGEYTINDTNETVAIGRKGINKVTSHSMGNEAHLKSLIAVPDIIQNAIFITEEVAEKKNAQYPKYRYYVVGLKIGGEDYTVKVTIGVDENGNKYYDHALTEIEKGTLIDNLNGTNPVADNQNANGFISTGAEPNPSVTGSKDTKLRTILQTSPQENARKIKMATGWERGADGKWRYETPDFTFKDNPVVVPFDGYSLTNLGALINDEELFKAYPELEDMTVQYQNLPLGTLASYSPKTSRFPAMITIDDEFMQRKENPEWQKRVEEMEQEPIIKDWIEAMDREPFDNAAYEKAEAAFKASPLWKQYNDLLMGKGGVPRYIPGFSGEDVLAHEIQHAIQDIEGFAKGSNTRNSQYNNYAGEVESRNVERRMEMSPEERRSSLASDTEDISREDQLFIDNALNNSYERRTGNTAPQIPRSEANRANPGIGPLEYPNDNLGRPEHAEPRGGQDAGDREADGGPQPGTGRDDSQNGTDNGRRITDARGQDRRTGGRNHAAAGFAGEQPRSEDRRGWQRGTSSDTEPEGDNRVAGADNRRPSLDNSGLGGTTGERRERVRRAAVEAGERLGVKVHILHSPGEVTNRAARREIANGNRVAGWYDIPSRRVYIYLPDIANESEAIKTVLHEAVGHKGLRQLLGLDKQEYDAAMMRLYGQLPLSERQKVADKAMLDYGGDFAVAMDEYLAEQAERDETPSWWNRVKSAVRDMLRSLGLNVELSDNDVKYLLWRSRKVLSNNNPFEVAEDLQMRRKLGIDDSTVRFRTAKEEVEENAPSGESMVKAWDRLMSSDWFKMKEALYDYLLSVEKFQKLVAQKTKSKILDFENAYWSLLAVSSRNKDEFDRLESKFIPELNNAIRSLVGQVKGKWDWSKGPLRDLVMYVEAKHGIERNRDLAVRKGIESLAKEPLSRFVKAGIVSEQEVDAFRKEAERKAKEKAEKKAKGTYARVFKQESEKEGVTKEYAKEKARQAAESRRDQVEQATLEKEERDFKHNCMKQLYKKWEDAKHDLFQQQIPWEEKQARLDEAAREFQWKDDGGNFGAVFGNDYSGLSSVFKPEGEDSNARNTEWDRLAHEYVKKYEQEHEASAIDNLWTSIKNLSEYSLRKQNETGLINKEYLQNNLGRFEYFIPLRGFEDTTAGEVYDYIYNNEIRAGSPVKAMEGRSSEAANPFGGLLSVAYSSITSGNKNLAKQKFLNLIRNHDTEGLATVSDVWIRNVGTKEEEDWVEAAPEIKENASPDEVAQAMNDFEEKMKALQEEGLALKTKGGHSDIPYRTLGGQRNEHQVQVLVGGNRYIITINGNPRVAQALNGLTNPDVDESGMWAYGKKVQQFMAGAFTSYNAAFSLANLSRDTGYSSNMVFINEDVKYWKEFLKNQKAGFFELPKMASFLRAYREGNIDNLKGNDAKLFKEFMMNGGATGYTFIENQKEYAEKLVEQMKELSKGNLSNMSPRKWLKLMFDSFEFMGNAAELVNRFAVYKTSRSVGRSIARSINDAKEVTINFSRKGAGRKTYDPKNKWYVNLAAAISQFGRQYILFWNASLQGKVKLFKSAMNHPVKALPSFVGGAAGIGMMLPFLNNMFLPMLYQMFGVGGDDDDKEDYYDVLSDYDREKNICLRLPGGGYWLKIPVSPDMSIFMGLGDKIAGNILGKREIDITDGVKAMADVTSPIGLNWNYEGTAFALNAFPTVVQPVMQTMMNVNFMGSPIKKESINRAKAFDPEYTKVYRSASSSLVELSKLSNNLSGGDAVKAGMIDWNPAVLQNFINGYTGGFGSVLIGMADMVVDASKGEKAEVAVSRYPLVSRFLSGGDIEVKKRRVNANYQSKVVDFVNETEHRYKGYERMIADPKITDFDRAEYMVKYNELTNTKDFKKYFELKSYIDAIKDYEKWLKDFGANDDIENQLYELKLRALEILDKKE